MHVQRFLVVGNDLQIVNTIEQWLAAPLERPDSIPSIFVSAAILCAHLLYLSRKLGRSLLLGSSHCINDSDEKRRVLTFYPHGIHLDQVAQPLLE